MKHCSVVIRSRLHAAALAALFLAALFLASAQAIAESITHADQRINIVYAASLDTSEREQTVAWLQRVTDALLTVYGEWPKDTFNISIQSSSRSDSPVPWGQVTRGDPDTVLLVINPEAELEALTADWTAFHELSHLLIPYRGYGDLWFSEGLASYYQNIIQARAGLLSESEFWDKLASGFERGRKQVRWPQLNLAEISDDMKRYREFMRVHWSGVHYWLSADIKLRQRSQNKKTLDSLLKQIKDCCQHSSMSAAEIADQLDQLAGENIFKPLLLEYRVSRAMPDYTPVLSGLGVNSDKHSRKQNVVLSNAAANADIRTSIYAGK